MASTIFGKGGSSPRGLAGSGQTSVFGAMRNNSNQKPGIPLPYGYRPVDRPMGNHLGRRFAGDDVQLGFGNTGRVPAAATYWRDRVSGVKKFSWEES